MRLLLGCLLIATSSLAGDKPQPTAKPASVLPGCACSTATPIPGGSGVSVYNCTCPADDGRPLQCVVGTGGVTVSVSCSR